MDVFAFFGVVSDRPVPGPEPHIPDLSFSRVEEHAVGIPSVFVSVLLPTFPGEQEDERPILGCRDSSLPLAPVEIVDLGATIVDTSNLEHGCSLPTLQTLPLELY